jgi:hypothetical protein
MHFTTEFGKFDINSPKKNGHKIGIGIAVDNDDFKDVDFFINGSGEMIIHAGNLQIRTVEKMQNVDNQKYFQWFEEKLTTALCELCDKNEYTILAHQNVIVSTYTQPVLIKLILT